MDDLEKQPRQTSPKDAQLAPCYRASGTSSPSEQLKHLTIEPKAERRLLFKLDRVIIPLCILLYLLASLDRSNLGNSKLMGLQDDVLGGSDLRFSIALSCFFITYALFAVPSTLAAKALNPARSIALGALIWGIAASCLAAAQNPAGVYVCRLWIGIGESLAGTSITLYYSYWYRKNEIAKRLGVYVSAGAIAGGFSGLIAYGVASISSPSIASWRILFLIDGLPSILLAVVLFFGLPSRPHTSNYLTEEERALELRRLDLDSLGETGTRIDLRAVGTALTDWKCYVIAVVYACMNLTLGSVTSYLPAIVKGLGYTNARAQLYTVPPYACAFGLMILLTTISDRLRTRGLPVMVVFLIGIIGWSLLLGVSPVEPSLGALRARYFACHCIVSAGLVSIPLLLAWVSDNAGSQSQRAVALGLLNLFGQSFSILAAFLFPSSDGPEYIKGASVNAAFQGLGLLLTGGMTGWYRWENRRRDREEGGQTAVVERNGKVLDVVERLDRAPGFRYTP